MCTDRRGPPQVRGREKEREGGWGGWVERMMELAIKKESERAREKESEEWRERDGENKRGKERGREKMIARDRVRERRIETARE